MHRAIFAHSLLAAMMIVEPVRGAPAPLLDTATSSGPDLILANGHVKTPDGWAEALAVHEGVIIAVGSSEEVARLRKDGTRTIDLGGRTVLPGLHDLHVHPIYAGVREAQCKIPQGSNLERTLNLVRACVDKAKPGDWIIGGQWDASALGKIPNRAMLDKVAPNNPVYLEDTSGHSNWVNSQVLKLAGVTKETPNPPGGIFERDADGVPSGVQRESAVDVISRITPKPTLAQAEAGLRWSLQQMLSFGITSFTEAAVGFTAGGATELATYAAIADAGQLKQRVRLCITWAPGVPSTLSAIASRNIYSRNRLAADCVKIFLDGVPTDSHTAGMLEPYAGGVGGRNDEASRMGLLLIQQDVLDKAVADFDRQGLTVKFHAAGDAAVREGLNAIEAARKANGFTPNMHNVGHSTFVAPGDIKRARAIGATFEVSPYLWGPTPINDDITKAVGPETIERVWPVREMLEADALVVPGSDWSVVPSVNPWIGLEQLVTRERSGGSADSFGKSEAISFEQAFRIFTENSARQEGMGNKVGRIVPGMLADIIVTNQNPFAVPPTKIHETRVDMTFIEGELVYRADVGEPAK